MTTIIERAQTWADGDCDEETRAEILALIEAKDTAQLTELCDGDLEFGTAGLRAKVGAGSLRMNRSVVRRTSRAVAEHLLETHPDARNQPVVVGYDGRLSSRDFAEQTVSVLAAAGLPVRYFEEPVPTPLVAYALRKYQATAAIVVTASHNPQEYNGYKLYAPNGAQIVSPTDELIAKRITELGPAKAIATSVGDPLSGEVTLALPVAKSVIDDYYRDIDAFRPKAGAHRDLRIVYTPMHGVGAAPVKRALAGAGFTKLSVVPEQAEPDGHFPTVRFPNPEEEGALDLALALARKEDAQLILANDPDADRLAACIPFKSGWKQLSGNQIGLLLADYLLSRYPSDGPNPLVTCSLVSSPMLSSIAAKYGAHCEQTLTGFKWLWNAALDLREQKELHFVFGFEEALGYSAGDIVRDKDGVSGALLFAEMSSENLDSGGVIQFLEGLYREHGLWVSVQKSCTLQGSAGARQIAAALEKLANEPPSKLSGFKVVGVEDFRVGEESRPRWLGKANMLQFDLGTFGRVLVRPSGTEPKIKFYVDLRQPVSANADVWDEEAAALVVAREIATAVVAAAGLG